MEGQDWLCSSCGRTQASWFCLCQQAPILLCQNCFPSHFTKNLGRSHVTHPIQAFPYRAIPGYFDRLAQRSTAVPLACEELSKNLTTIDSVIRELHEKAKGVIEAVQEYVRMEMQKLHTLRTELQADIEAAVVEVQGSLYEEQPTLSRKYAAILRTADLAPLRLITYRIGTAQSILQQEFVKLSPDVQVGYVVPQIFGNSLRRYDLLTGQTTAAMLTTSFPYGTVFCLLDEDTVLCVGGCEGPKYLSTAYELELPTAKTISLQAMKRARGYPGITKHGSFAYVFGGYSGSYLKACEKFGIAHRAWSVLPDMHHERYAFSPCVVGNDIYLPDVSRSHNVLEVFNVSTEAFKALPLPLFNCLSNNSVSFIVDGELIIIACCGQMGKWRINAEQTIRVSPINLNGISAFSNFPPMRSGRQIFWAQYNSVTVAKFDIDSQSLSNSP